ncbi:MAG: hydrogenase maturation nickel metallochaperone HypA [Thermoplasmatota archaeon]
MHEFSTMSSIVASVLEEGEKHDATAVTRVVLDIGELTFLGEEQLRFAFQVLSEGTLLEGAELVVNRVAPEVRCDCGYTGDVEYDEKKEFHVRFPLLRCPECGGSVEVRRGRECLIKHIEIERDDVSAEG